MQTNLEYLQQAISVLREEVEPLTSRVEHLTIDAATTLWLQLSELKDLGEAISKIANIALPTISEHCRKLIEMHGMESMTKKYGDKSFVMTPDVKYRVSVTKERHPAFIEWMRAHPRGKELIKEDVHNATLTKFIVEEVEAGNTPPPMVSVYEEPTLKVRKSR